jgi:hypothetical protein
MQDYALSVFVQLLIIIMDDEALAACYSALSELSLASNASLTAH